MRQPFSGDLFPSKFELSFYSKNLNNRPFPGKRRHLEFEARMILPTCQSEVCNRVFDPSAE